MPSAGELLRYEREMRNRTLSEIASETCISTRYLQAIEADDPKILPGDFFHRSFIRQYADCLKLDCATTKAILDAVEPAPEIDLLPAFSIPQQIAEAEQQARPLAHVPTRVAATLLFVVLAGCSGLSALWNRAQEAADPALQIVQAAAADPVTLPSSALPVIPAEQPAAAEGAGQIAVAVAATEKTWVSVSSEGKTVYAGMLDADQTKNFALAHDGKLLTRNAAGLEVRMNGRSLGPLGPRGQVRMVLFSQDHFQIVSPRKL
jgi:transcriptional regulator with XRE-family HTH domain